MTHFIARREPLGVLFDDFFNDLFARSAPATRQAADSSERARMDVIDRGDRYEVLADLPGVRKEDIQVTVEGNRVSIAAEAKAAQDAKSGKEKSHRVLHRERCAASYARSFELPVEVSDEGAVAAFENGVLRLELPKRAALVGKRLAIH